jgi:hypothetical protein
VPLRKIFSEKDLEAFKKSPACAEIIEFVKICADAIIGLKVSDTSYPVSDVTTKIALFMNRMHDAVTDFPPLKQPMRFGNKAFRQWHAYLVSESPSFILSLVGEDQSDAINELLPYLTSSFG